MLNKYRGKIETLDSQIEKISFPGRKVSLMMRTILIAHPTNKLPDCFLQPRARQTSGPDYCWYIT